MSEFNRSLAAIIGIDQCGNDIPPLCTAVNVANRFAEILMQEHCCPTNQEMIHQDASSSEAIYRLLI
ncbi:hypothetical protein DCC62_21530 [candidate division KSB1 bacterium]|nr:MAG: hypothetical protein DCC62_21530 [candidate division KSB1 bacterium]